MSKRKTLMTQCPICKRYEYVGVNHRCPEPDPKAPVPIIEPERKAA